MLDLPQVLTLFLVCMGVLLLSLTGCASTKSVGEQRAETTISPGVDQAAIQAMGPPPGYVKPENYWVREKIILGVASEPSPPATQKSSAKKGKKGKKAS